MKIKNIIYSLACLSFAIVIGGGVYEHLAMVPMWSAAPPTSLTMFDGQYGVKPEFFWTTIHPITLALFIAALATSWQSARRVNIFTAFTGYIGILAVTAIYFVPELIDIITTAYSDQSNEELTDRAAMWETLSLVRLVILVGLSMVLFNGLTKDHAVQLRSKLIVE